MLFNKPYNLSCRRHIKIINFNNVLFYPVYPKCHHLILTGGQYKNYWCILHSGFTHWINVHFYLQHILIRTSGSCNGQHLICDCYDHFSVCEWSFPIFSFLIKSTLDLDIIAQQYGPCIPPLPPTFTFMLIFMELIRFTHLTGYVWTVQVWTAHQKLNAWSTCPVHVTHCICCFA